GAVPSLQTQATAYITANGGKVDANALYSVWSGANDMFPVLLGLAAPETAIAGAVGPEVGVIGALQAAGARYVLVPNMPDLGLTPRLRAAGAVGMAQGTALAAAYNDALYG